MKKIHRFVRNTFKINKMENKKKLLQIYFVGNDNYARKSFIKLANE